MSGTLECAEFVDLAAAVAVHATDDAETSRVEEHAEACPDCGKILRGVPRSGRGVWHGGAAGRAAARAA